MVGIGWKQLANTGGTAWLSPTRSAHIPAAFAACATSTRCTACSTVSVGPIGRSTNAPGGSEATIAWYIANMSCEVGNTNLNDVPILMPAPIDWTPPSRRSARRGRGRNCAIGWPNLRRSRQILGYDQETGRPRGRRYLELLNLNWTSAPLHRAYRRTRGQ